MADGHLVTVVLTEEEVDFLKAILSDMLKQGLGKMPVDPNMTPIQRRMLEAAFKVTREVIESVLSKLNNASKLSSETS